MPPGTLEAYEGLRQEVVQPERLGAHPEGRGVLMRRGLATWAQIRLAAVTPSSAPLNSTCGSLTSVLDILATELVRLVAGLILSTRREGFQHG